MNKIIRILIISLLLISVASAAVYTVTTNPEAKAYFSREKPVPTIASVQTMMQMDDGAWSNSADFGKMSWDTFSVDIRQTNMADTDLVGTPMIEITCDEGLTPWIEGIYEFTDIIYTAPNGDVIHCGDKDDIQVVSDTMIRIDPTGAMYLFEPGNVKTSSVNLEFFPGAWGNYTLSVYIT